MPNNITNLITLNTTDESILNEFFTLIKPKNTNNDSREIIDFNNIVEMPEEIRKTNGEYKPSPESQEAKLRAICLKKYNSPTWYEWSLDNWGTKWNAYGQKSVSNNSFEFDTAWNHPMPIVTALSFKFPNVEFVVRYADEDLGYNFGHYTIKNGVVKNLPLPKKGTMEAREFSADVKGLDLNLLYEDEF